MDKEKRFVKVPVVLFDAVENPAELAVWCALASFMNLGGRDDLVWPSQSRLGSMVGLGRTTINKVLKSLEKKGLIVMDSSDLGVSNCYAIQCGIYTPPVQNPNNPLFRM